MILRRRKAEKRRQAIHRELLEMFFDPYFYEVSNYINDVILYTEIGKDRLSLPDDYVARTRRHAIERIEWRKTILGS